MKTTTKLVLALVGAGVVASAAVGAVAFVRWLNTPSTATAPAKVPSSWKEARKGPGHQSHLGAGVECGSCHMFRVEGFEPAELAECATCHAPASDGLHLVNRSDATPTCLSCHPFSGVKDALPPVVEGAPSWPPHEPQGRCAACHAQVGPLARPVVFSGALPTFIAQHSSVDCEACHLPHQSPSLSLATCRSCHVDSIAVHPDVPGIPGPNCLDCHVGHAPAVAAKDGCAKCHAEQRPAQAAHAQCASCHRPHEVEQGGLAPCASCHAKQVAPVAAPPAHQLCGSCHDPHDAQRGQAKKCSSCHLDAPTDRAHHDRKLNCQSCHAPHAPALVTTLATCGRCHEPEAAAAAKVDGHTRCAECHLRGAHAPDLPPVRCASCHQAELAAAPAGHQDCARCHEPHGGAVLASATCASCHEKQLADAHGKEGCAECHAAHGPKGEVRAPACATCHAPAERGGLHASKGHADCARCHSGHPPAAKKDRYTCVSCHAAQLDHVPEATSCSGCHPFTR